MTKTPYEPGDENFNCRCEPLSRTRLTVKYDALKTSEIRELIGDHNRLFVRARCLSTHLPIDTDEFFKLAPENRKFAVEIRGDNIYLDSAQGRRD